MIRCSHCGKLAPDGAKSCQHCGMPLVNMGNGLPGAGPVEKQQEELPAWLESLRAHERPVASGLGNNQPFTMDELVDENRMPRWMSQEHPRMSDSGSSDSLPAIGINEQPGLGTEKAAFPASGFSAGSLIDEQSLPEWMRGAEMSEQPGLGQNFSAHNLVDQQALPAWIKELGQGGPAVANEAQYGLPTQPPAPATPPASANVPRTPPTPARHEPAAPLTHGFSAHDLVDQQALPSWMSNEAQGAGTPPPTRPVPAGSGFSASELIDGQALPNWMQDQPGPTKAGSTSAMGVPVNGSGQMAGMGQTVSGEGMPASTLLDMNSMPTWMREDEPQASQPGLGLAAGSLVDKDGLPAWMREEEQGGKPQAGSGLAAGSLIDKDGLPPWMREQSGAGQPQSTPRNEGMRVPSRPRSDTGMLAQSDEAANIFSSMLGVSASAPVMPGQAPLNNNNLGVAQMPTTQYPPQQQTPQPVIPGWQTPPQTPAQAAQPQAWQMASPVPASPVPNPYAQGYQANSMSGMQAQPSMPGQAAYPGQMAANMPGNGSALGVANTMSTAPQATETKKKGFFGSILDFFGK